MVSVKNTTPDEEGPQEHTTPPIDVEAELDRDRTPAAPASSSDDLFAGTTHEGHGHSQAGVATKVMFVRTIGEVTGMVAAWALVMRGMNGLAKNSVEAWKNSTAEKLILPRVDRIEGLVQKYIPGLASKKLIEARETGDKFKIARQYAPYVTDMPVAVVASFGGKVWAQEELNKRLDVPLDTHENITSAVLDNAVQLGSFAYLASPVGKGTRDACNRMMTKIIKPYVKEADLSNYADYATSLQVPNALAFGASSLYLVRQALDTHDKEQQK